MQHYQTYVDILNEELMPAMGCTEPIALAYCASLLKDTLKDFDAAKYGGAPLLGLNGLVVKTHGSSKAMEVTNSIFQCVTFKQQDINGKIKENIIVETTTEE